MNTRLPLCLLCLLGPAAHAYTETDITERWKPIVTFAGNGQPQLAIDRLRGINDVQKLMVDNSRFDDASRHFIDELWGSIEDFNLSRFYSILPEKNGDWRELHVEGRRQGDAYCYVDVSRQHNNAIERINTLGDSSLWVRAKKIDMPDHHQTHYLMGMDWRIGWGSYSWQSFRNTVNQSVALLSLPNEKSTDLPDIAAHNVVTKNDAFTKDITKENIETAVRQMNPTLGDEDVAVIAPLWAAFPHLWESFAAMGKVEDVLVDKDTSIFSADPHRQGLRDVNIVISLDRKKLKLNYPAIADYLQRINDLVTMNLAVANHDGRLMNLTLDTTGLKVRINMLVDGVGLVPVENGQAKRDKIVYFADQDIPMAAVVDASIDMLGVHTDISHIASTVNYHPYGDGVRIELAMNTLPTVKVQGRALGIIPTGFIDTILPTRLDDIILEFMSVAIKGNEGKGIVASVTLENTPNWGVTNLTAKGDIEALDSLLARIGVAIVNQRLMPSEDQGQALLALTRASRKAFDEDLALYEKLVIRDTVAQVTSAH